MKATQEECGLFCAILELKKLMWTIFVKAIGITSWRREIKVVLWQK